MPRIFVDAALFAEIQDTLAALHTLLIHQKVGARTHAARTVVVALHIRQAGLCGGVQEVAGIAGSTDTWVVVCTRQAGEPAYWQAHIVAEFISVVALGAAGLGRAGPAVARAG